MPAVPPRGPDPKSNPDATTNTSAATTTLGSQGSPSDSGSTTSSADSAQKQMAAAVASMPTAASRFAQTFTLVYNTEDGAEPIPLQIDTDDSSEFRSEEDSTYGSDTGSTYSGSVTSSIYQYQYENGRRYHAYREGQYVLPNDSQEQERLNLQHHIWRLLLGGRLYTAPLPSPSVAPAGMRILDLGTGTGIWAMDMAEEFGTADVQGIDLSPIQPDWIPNNCHFYVDDYEDEWTYREDEQFDYIHGRALSGTSADWPRFYQQVKDALKPGGWVEMQEYDAWIFSDDDSCDRAPNTMEWVAKLDGASRLYGKPINVASLHRQWMIDAGFEDVKELVYRIPIGSWPKNPQLKELGRFELVHMHMSVDSHTPALFTRVLNYTPEQAHALMEGVKREFRDKELRLITTYRFLTGRRPGGSGGGSGNDAQTAS